MSNNIIIRNNSLVELTKIDNITNPLISEQVNAHYTFTFGTIIDDKASYLNSDNIIEVDNDYFRVARTVKTRNTSVNMTVDCEHITYDLLDKYRYPMPFEEFEGSPQQMMTTLLSGTPFRIGQITVGGDHYIKPNSDNIRGTLIEIANLFGGELVYDKFTISLVARRGVVSNQEFKLGENLIGVTLEIDYTEGYPRKALEVDIVDLSQVPGYGFLRTIGLGDTVTTIDPILNVNETLRIVSRDYNPFQKINPSVQIGYVIRDITDYVKEEKEETLPELNISEFKIGIVDCLSLGGVDITDSYRQYLSDKTPYTVSATVEYPELESLVGLFVKRSNDQIGIRVKEISNGTTTDFYYKDLDSLKTSKYPKSEDTVVLVILAHKDIDSLTANDKFKVFAVKFATVPFEGHIIIKNKDENGLIISTTERTVDKIGKYAIDADTIDGYELTSATSVVVEITVKESTKTVYFEYKATGTSGSKKGYVLEFGTAPASSVTIFNFENTNGYDAVESITPGIIGPNSYRALSTEPISNGSKYIGVKVFVSGDTSGARISVQAVCFNGGDD